MPDARDLVARLSRGRVPGQRSRLQRLDLPRTMRAPLGCDAVGVSEEHGRRVMGSLPGTTRIGCVFADADQWWWIVPPQSDTGLRWPSTACYTSGLLVPVPPRTRAFPRSSRARLVHTPEDDVPYTHPLLLYIAVCRTAGVPPSWALRHESPLYDGPPDPGRQEAVQGDTAP